MRYEDIPNQRRLDDAIDDTIGYDDTPVERGNKFEEYTIREPVGTEYYDGEIWHPNAVGNKLKGRYIDCLEHMGRYDKKMYVIDGDRMDGLYDKVFGCSRLDQLMDDVEPSSVIEIEYKGMKEGKNGKYHDYKIDLLWKPDDRPEL